MAGYVRQSTIADGNTIDASLFNNEFDALLAAFVNTTGHKHDGTAANGPVIGLIGDAGKILKSINPRTLKSSSYSCCFEQFKKILCIGGL